MRQHHDIADPEMPLKLKTKLMKTISAFKNIENVIPKDQRHLHTITKKTTSKNNVVKRTSVILAARKSEGQSDQSQNGGGATTEQTKMPVLARAMETKRTVVTKAVERKMPAWAN